MYYNSNDQLKVSKINKFCTKMGQKNAHNAVVCAVKASFLFKKFAQLK
jgi:hypothetical protein